METEPTLLLSIPVGIFLGIWAFRKFQEKKQREAEWEKNKDKYKYKGYR
tara:strand:+ start:289 stop:435 length:147 start_codon:yes stop_codon:yes gene_type:complete